MASASNRMPSLQQRLRSLRRVALAVARPGGPTLHADLVRELAQALEAPVVFVAVFEDDSQTSMRTQAAQLDGRPLRPADFVRDRPALCHPGIRHDGGHRVHRHGSPPWAGAYAAYPLDSTGRRSACWWRWTASRLPAAMPNAT
jgi:hypothetical protein